MPSPSKPTIGQKPTVFPKAFQRNWNLSALTQVNVYFAAAAMKYVAPPTRFARQYRWSTWYFCQHEKPVHRVRWINLQAVSLHSNPTEDPKVHVDGWPLLAKVMVEAFPAFSNLNMKSLLYYQSRTCLIAQGSSRNKNATTLDNRTRTSDQVLRTTSAIQFHPPKILLKMSMCVHNGNW